MLVILQLDAVSVPLLRRLMAEGQLPAIAGLNKHGRWLDLKGPGSHTDAGACFTAYSGRDAGEHGLYYPFQWSAREQRVRYTTSFPLPEMIWEQLSRTGRRSLVVDPYFGWPPQGMQGVCVSGWQLTNRVVLRRWARPQAELRRLARRYGASPAADEVFGYPSGAWLRSLRKKLLPASTRVVDAALDCLGRDRFDFCWVTFVAPHIAGHWLWDFAQFGRRDLPSLVREELETALVDIYVAMDRAVGRMVAALPPETDLLLLSPIGMGPNTSCSDLLPAMLAAVLHEGGQAKQRRKSDGGTLASRLRTALPTDLRGRIARMLPDRFTVELIARLEQPRVDWRVTPAFALPSDNQGYLRFNLQGRERKGFVEPSEVRGLIDKISAGFLSFRDPDGNPTVASVDRTSEFFSGLRSHMLPDLVVQWSNRPAVGLERVTSPEYGAVARVGVGTGRTGTHTGDAWVLLVPGSSRLRQPSRPAHLVDIAATACALLGSDSKDLPGEPLLEK